MSSRHFANNFSFTLCFIFILGLSVFFSVQPLAQSTSPSYHETDTSTPLEHAKQLFVDNKKQELIDFLNLHLERGTFQNSDKFEAYNQLFGAYKFLGNMSEATRINNQLMLEALEAENMLYVGRSFINEGEMLQNQGNYESALQVELEALNFYKKAGNAKYTANALLEISYSLIKLNRNIEALDYANQSLNLGNEIEDLETIASANNSIGMIQENLGNLVLALEAHQKTIELDRARGDLDELSTSYFNVATIYKKMKEYEQARFFTNEALQLDLPGKNPEHIGYDYAMLAELSTLLNEPETARQQAQQALSFFQKTDAQGHMGWVYNILARLELASANFEQAEEYLQKAYELNKAVSYEMELMQSQLLDLELKLARAQYEEAFNVIETLLPQSIENRNYEQTRSLISMKSDALEQVGRYQEALQAYKDYNQLRDNFEAENRSVILAQLQNQMDYLHKEHRIELLESQAAIKELRLEQAKLERNLWVAGLVLVCLVIGIIGYREHSKRRISAYEKELLADSIERKNAMLAEVAHELRSPLTALHLQIESLQYNLEDDTEAAYLRLNNKVKEINQLIEDLYDLARADNGLLRLNFEQVPVHELMDDITEGYNDVLQHKGLELKTNVQIAEEESFNVDAHRIKQVIVNLLRNSMNYTDTPGIVACSVFKKDKMVEISLEDSAPGVTENEIPRLFERMYRADHTAQKDTGGSGLGLSICKSLIEAHQGEIKAQSSELGGLKVSILLPANIDEDAPKAA